MSPALVADLLHESDQPTARIVEGIGGTPVANLARALVELGSSVEVVTTAWGLDGPLVLSGPKMRVLATPLRRRARDRARDLFRFERRGLEALIAQTHGDVLHAHWTYEFAWAAQAAGRPLVVTAHDAPLTIFSHHRDAYRLMRLVMAVVVRSRLRHLVAVSPYLAQRWRREMRYAALIDVVPNIVESQEVAKADEACTGRIGVVADGSRLKNVGALLRAFPSVVSAVPDAELVVVGPGLDGESAFAKSAAASGLERVQFLGPLPHDEVLRLLRTCSAYVHPSLEETFSMAVVEAMAAGLPVVGGQSSGGVPWVLADGAAGHLVDVRDPAELADGILLLLRDRPFADSLAAEGRRRAAALFSAEAVASSYLEIYERVASGCTRVAAA
jgi:glycosyltransferase involved in cell wall biosynthesis